MSHKRYIRILSCLVLISLLAVFPVLGTSLSPELVTKFRQEGKLAGYVKSMLEARARGADNPARQTMKLRSRTSAEANSVDTMRVIIILVDFTDQPYTGGYVAAMPAQFDSLLFSENHLNSTGSMTEFFLENSYGKFFIQGDVFGWFRMPQTYAYYVDNQRGFGYFPRNAQGLARDAALAADPTVDFSLYDSYGPSGFPDDQVDGLFIVHSGAGYEESGRDTDIHSHQWFLGENAVILDGVTVDTYSCEPEERINTRSITDIGVFCHEYGHVIGFPDFYDVDYDPPTSDGLGVWSLMASGSWNNSGRTPAQMDAWCKAYAGFITPIEVTANKLGVEIPQTESEPLAYRLWADGQPGPEYFLVENRQNVGFDVMLPGHGLLIYHVDDTRWGNIDVYHYHVALEQADGDYGLEFRTGDGDAGDPYPGASLVRSFDDLSDPNSRSYGGETTQVSVWNISNSDSLMTANLDIRWSRPRILLDSSVFADANADGILDSGETIQFYLFLNNAWKTASNVTVTVISNDPDLEFSASSIEIPQIIGDGGKADNLGTPIVFTVPDLDYPRFDTFYVTISSNTDFDYQITYSLEKVVGKTEILIVDDDRGDNYETMYYGDLKKNQAPADIWEKATKGSPGGADLGRYKMVVWFTGDTSSNLLFPQDIEAMKQFLDNGGSLFLTGQCLAAELQNEDSAFLADYLHARADMLAYNNIHYGVAGSPIGDSLKVRYFSGDNQEFTLSRQIQVLEPAIPAFNFGNLGPSALSYEDSYRVVFFNWGYEAITNEFPKYNTRDDVMTRILRFQSSWTPHICIDSDGDHFGDPGHPENSCPVDNCPSVYNPDQSDTDGDGIGDSCDYICGDVSSDNIVSLMDIVFLIRYLGFGGTAPNPYHRGDLNGDQAINMLDIVYMVNYLYKGGPAAYCP